MPERSSTVGTVSPDSADTAVHPYRRAWETRDLGAWGDALSDELVTHSPMLRSPFVGRELALELFEVLFASTGEFQLTAELSDGDLSAFFWRAQLGGDVVEGADLIRLDARGKVCEIRVLIRPLVGIGRFGAAIGPRLASRRGRLRSPLVRVLNAPIGGLFAVIDRVASALAVPKTRR